MNGRRNIFTVAIKYSLYIIFSFIVLESAVVNGSGGDFWL